MRVRTIAVLLITLTYVAMVTASANSLIATSPTSGSSLTSAPSSVTLTTQVGLIIDASEIIVTDPTGLRVDDGTISVNGVSASIGLKPLIESGIYRVSYTLYSEGEAPVAGSFTFNFSVPSVISPVEPTPISTQRGVPAGSSWGTNVFIISILVFAFFILIGLSIYARKIFKDR